MPQPYSIKIFVADGDPEGIRIIDRMNWTGKAIAFPRNKAKQVAEHVSDFDQPGVYILIGQDDEENLNIYIGQATNVNKRIIQHISDNFFWDRAIVFISSNNNLNSASIQWLEYSLISRTHDLQRTDLLRNKTKPTKPPLSKADEADVQIFFDNIKEILPLLDLHVFSDFKTLAIPNASHDKETTGGKDTIVVPAKEEGFQKVFLNENSWYSVRISSVMLENIKYIAAYRTHPVSAITHYASIASIVSHGEQGKFKLIFSGKAKEFGLIPFGNASGGFQSARYTSLTKLLAAKTVEDI